MSQRIDQENVQHSSSIVADQDPPLISKGTSIDQEPEPVLENKTVEKKSFSERWQTNRFWLVRGSYHVLRSVWMVAMFIGGLIAWLISLLFI
ncbi:hypothetical protein [Aequorivita capsosiphonis]|uniref:hypothetical protein n=1 Tax=Aequorivita capsosiphonis TaxID=487317 RepID=UPI0003F91E42|nr:hypothetical protein [Aequorivita capsosiphonis]